MLEDIRDSSQRLNRLILNFLLYADLERTAVSPERIKALQKSQVDSIKTVVSDGAKQQAQQFNRGSDLQISVQEASVQI
ncbi:MAG: hypothetical protein AAFO04_09220 [Cyanobacteria bacterium J06592_8]